MTNPTLVISNPPHAEKLGLASAASLLELSADELRLKAQYQVPEIWIAEPTPERAKGYARALALAGFSVVLVRSEPLVAVPAGSPVTGFRFDDAGIEFDVAEGPTRLGYQERFLAVWCNDRDGQVPPRCDFYARPGGRVQRFTVEQGSTSMRGLLDAERRIGVVGNLQTFLSTCEQRFPHLTVDRRLQNMRLRKRVNLLSDLVEKRRGYSFATSHLEDLLESLEPGASQMSQPELSSRLVFLTYVAQRA